MIIKATCLNCGKEVEGELYEDELGKHIVCSECGASFDVILLNEKEKEFIEDLHTADSYVPDGWELEIDRWWGDEDDSVPGWYAMKYSEERGEALLLEEYSHEAIITENEAIENNIDVNKCIEAYGCYYVG